MLTTSPNRLRRIRLACTGLMALCLLVAVVWPVAVAGTLATMPDAQLFQGFVGRALTGPDIPITTRVLAIALSVVPVLVASTGVLALLPGLSDMRAGQLFPATAFRDLQLFAVALLLSALLRLLITPMQSLLLTAGRDERTLVISIGSDVVQSFALGLGMWLLAWIFAEGRALASENAEFI